MVDLQFKRMHNGFRAIDAFNVRCGTFGLR